MMIQKSTRVWLISAIGLIAFIMSGCSSTVFVVPTLPAPTVTSTPLSTALPTVSTQVPLGSSGNPYHMIVVSNSNAIAGDALATYLTGQLGPSFHIDFLTSDGDALTALCNGTTSFAWLDGNSLLAALAQNCGTVALKIQRGADLRTGIKSDLVVRSGGKGDPTVVTALKGRDFCRLAAASGEGGQDPVSWILPVMLIRAAGLDAALDIHTKELPDTPSMLQAVADGTCVAAGIPSGTLSTFNPTVPTGDKLVVLQSSPELPYGGLVAANNIPSDLITKMAKLLGDNPSQVSTLVTADGLISASTGDYADFQTAAKSAGINLKTLAR